MAKDPEKDRSARLLSKEALPKIDIPRAPPPAVPQFMLPKAASGPVKVPDAPPPPKLPEAPKPKLPAPKPPEPPKPAEEPPPIKIEGRRRRPSTGKFKDRTLGWFAIGDQMADKAAKEAAEDAAEAAADGAPPSVRARGPALAIALGAAAVLTLVVIWLVLR
jgi:hypothetical protein